MYTIFVLTEVLKSVCINILSIETYINKYLIEAESRMIMTKPALARSASKHRKKPQEILSSESITSNGSQRPRNLVCCLFMFS